MAPRARALAAASGFSLCGFLTVSSTLKIRLAASVEAERMFILTRAGSQTKLS